MSKKREDGRLQASFIYNGKRYYVYGTSKKELDQKIFKKKLELEDDQLNKANPILTDYYKTFTEIRRNKVKPSTIRNQQKWFNTVKCIKLGKIKLGDMRLKDIKSSDMKIVQVKLIEKGICSTSINDCLHHISHVFYEAINDGIISINPCKCLTTVKRTEPKARDTNHRALTEEETQLFIQTAAESFYINGFKLMLQTGIRLGELGALTASDFDFKSGLLSINKTVSRDEIGAYIINPTPKTDTSNRLIPITSVVKQIVSDQQKLLKASMIYTTQLFPQADGKLLRDYTYNREMARITKKMQIDKITSHAFRATFSTRFIEQRPQDYKILSEILGHSDVKITLNLYTHVMASKKQEAMEGLKIVM